MTDRHRRPFAYSSMLFALIGIAVLFSCTFALGQNTVTVPGDFANIQAALNASDSGDTILVSPGVYTQNLNFNGKSIALRSTDGPESTTIDVNGGIGVTIGGQAEITGFTISGAQSTFGAGIQVSGNGTLIKGNIFDGNTQSAGGYGAAIGGNSSSPIIDGNLFRNNTSDFQFLSGVVGFVNGSSPVIVNNIFHDNESRGINLTLPVGNNPQVINNTFVNNTVAVRVDRRVDASGLRFRNNILAENDIGLEIDFGSESNNPTWENNLVFQNGIDYETINDQTGINGNLSGDPLFVDRLANNFQLDLGSMAIDTGSPIDAPSIDFVGTLRPLDGDLDGVAQYDIGAFETIPVPEPLAGLQLAIGLVIVCFACRRPYRGAQRR